MGSHSKPKSQIYGLLNTPWTWLSISALVSLMNANYSAGSYLDTLATFNAAALVSQRTMLGVWRVAKLLSSTDRRPALWPALRAFRDLHFHPCSELWSCWGWAKAALSLVSICCGHCDVCFIDGGYCDNFPFDETRYPAYFRQRRVS